MRRTAGSPTFPAWFGLALLAPFVLAVASAGEQPARLPNGEIPWGPVDDAMLEKIRAALPDKPPAAPQKPRKLLVFCRADSFVHKSIPVWNRMLELLGEKTGAFQATVSQSYDDLTPERLAAFDAVFFNNNCRGTMPAAHGAALDEFVFGGKGIAGNHGFGDAPTWEGGRAMLGASFTKHPFATVQIKVDDPQSPLTATFGGKAFPFADEIYAFKGPYSREKLRVLLSVDYPNSPEAPRG